MHNQFPLWIEKKRNLCIHISTDILFLLCRQTRNRSHGLINNIFVFQDKCPRVYFPVIGYWGCVTPWGCFMIVTVFKILWFLYNHYRLEVQLPVIWKEWRLRYALTSYRCGRLRQGKYWTLPTFAPNKILFTWLNVPTTTSLRWSGHSFPTKYSLRPFPVENSRE